MKQKFGKSKICILITNSMADPIPCVLSSFSYYETLYMECYNVLLKYQPIKTGQKDKAILLKVVSNNKQTKYWIESIIPLVLLNNHTYTYFILNEKVRYDLIRHASFPDDKCIRCIVYLKILKLCTLRQFLWKVYCYNGFYHLFQP